MNYKNTILLLVLCFLSPLAKADNYKEIRNVSKSIKTEENSRINVTNKYGSISINTWEKDSVRIEIELTISGSNKTKVEKLANNIDFKFSGNESDYYVETEFGNDFNTFWNDLKSQSQLVIPGGKNVEINYTIYAPENIGLSLTNKYGEIYLDDFGGNLKINLSNGVLNTGVLRARNDIQLNFCDAIIDGSSDGEINISYTDLTLKSCQNLKLISRSSTIHIEEAASLSLDTRRDKVFISNVDMMKGESYFSKLSLDNIGKEMEYTVKYGMLEITQIKQELDRLKLTLRNTEVNLYVPKQFSSSIDVIIEKTVFKYPAEYDKLDIKVTNDDHKSFHVTGNTGSLPPSSQLSINAIKGSLNILYK